MAISFFYNSTAIYEIPIQTIDENGQLIDTWNVSTTIPCTVQGRSGAKSIVGDQEKARKNDRMYCDVVNIGSTGRFLFSTTSFVYAGTASASTDLESTATGALYNVATAFSTYSVGDYLINNGTTYVLNVMKSKYILYINDNLRGSHYQIDLKVDYGDRI